MDTRTIGSLTVSVVGLGCNNFGRRVDEDGTRRVVDASLDAGVTFFDTADIYGGTRSETFLGRILAGRRDRIVLATKFGMEVAPDKVGAAPDYVRRALHDSLERLQTDHVDLYQLHEPDPTVPIADTLAVLDELVREGLVREIGCSNFTAAQQREAAEAVADGAARFVSVQNELSLLTRADETDGLAGAAEQGLAYIPYFPLASGVLTGKYRRGEPPPPGTRLSLLRRDRRRRGVRPGRRAHARSPRSGGARCSSWRSAGCCRSPRSPRSSPARRSPNRSRPTSPRRRGACPVEELAPSSRRSERGRWSVQDAEELGERPDEPDHHGRERAGRKRHTTDAPPLDRDRRIRRAPAP